jgi:hypothetical protein
VPVTSTSPSDRGALSGLAAGVRFIAGVAGAMALADLPYPRPGADPTQIRAYFSQNAGPARFSAAGRAISAAALARFTVSVATLAGRSGRGSRPLQAAAVAGGGVAAASLAVASACAAALTGPSGRQDASAAALARRGFIAGGPVHAVGFGVLVGAPGLAGDAPASCPDRWPSPGWPQQPQACCPRCTSWQSRQGGSSRSDGFPACWSAASPGSGSPAAPGKPVHDGRTFLEEPVTLAARRPVAGRGHGSRWSLVQEGWELDGDDGVGWGV